MAGLAHEATDPRRRDGHVQTHVRVLIDERTPPGDRIGPGDEGERACDSMRNRVAIERQAGPMRLHGHRGQSLGLERSDIDPFTDGISADPWRDIEFEEAVLGLAHEHEVFPCEVRPRIRPACGFRRLRREPAHHEHVVVDMGRAVQHDRLPVTTAGGLAKRRPPDPDATAVSIARDVVGSRHARRRRVALADGHLSADSVGHVGIRHPLEEGCRDVTGLLRQFRLDRWRRLRRERRNARAVQTTPGQHGQKHQERRPLPHGLERSRWGER